MTPAAELLKRKLHAGERGSGRADRGGADEVDVTLAHALQIARVSLEFGQVRRATRHPDGELESDTTHTVMLILLGIEMARAAGCDPGLVAQFAAVHDLPETYAGDTVMARALSEAETAAKAGREASAIERLRSELGEASPLMSLIDRYERQQEPEARLVRYLDKVLPKLTHVLNGGAVLRSMSMSAAEFHERHVTQGAALDARYPEPELAEVKTLFTEAAQAVESVLG